MKPYIIGILDDIWKIAIKPIRSQDVPILEVIIPDITTHIFNWIRKRNKKIKKS